MGVSRLGIFDNYFKITAYSSSGANGFTLGTPATFICFNNSYYIVDHNQGVAIAYANAQSASITFLAVYHGHFSHYRCPLS